MNRFNRRLLFAVFMLAAVLLAQKGVELKTIGTNVDGSGIGISFLGFEVNDSVLEENIPLYTAGFLLMSVIMLISSVFVFRSGKTPS